MNSSLHFRNSGRTTFAGVGVLLYALATLAAGLFDLIWREFEAAHQPIGALGDHIPGRTILACIAAVWMIAAGAAVLSRRTARAGAAAAALVYLMFAAFWLPRFYTAPRALGFRVTLFVGLFAGVFTQLIAAAGGLILFHSRTPGRDRPTSVVIARFIFGIGSILFGLAHLTGVQSVAAMVPSWMPFGESFWVVVSGVAFIMAGLAIISGRSSLLAARLLGLMLVLFEPLVLLPNLIANPHNHIAWGANAYNLAAAGAVWIFAASLESQFQRERAPAVIAYATESVSTDDTMKL